MRRQELAEFGAGRGLAKPADQLALMVDDADPRSKVGDVAADRGCGTDLADIEDRRVPVWHAEAAGTVQILPLRREPAISVEHLDAMVFAVGDVDPAMGRASCRSRLRHRCLPAATT